MKHPTILAEYGDNARPFRILARMKGWEAVE
jgi:hypothetical protein